MSDLAAAHPFLANLKASHDPRFNDLEKKLQAWHLANPDFLGRLRAWFHNFGTEQDQALALRLLLAMDYYHEARLEETLRLHLDALKREEIYLSGDKRNALVVLPGNRVDSAYRHGWLISKIEGLPGKSFHSLDTLTTELIANDYLVLINDTHGSGNQFMREVWGKLKIKGVSADKVVVLGIAIAQQAHDEFAKAGFLVIPKDVANSADTQFNHADFKRLRAMGEKVSPNSPLGYGDTALLVAYHFQCPNNTLPLIWKKGTDDYPWKPLFEYREKTYSASNKTASDKPPSENLRATSTEPQVITLAAPDPVLLEEPQVSETPDPELLNTARRLIAAKLEESEAAAERLAERFGVESELPESRREAIAAKVLEEPLDKLFDIALDEQQYFLNKKGDTKAANIIADLVHAILPAKYLPTEIATARANKCGQTCGLIQLLASHKTIAEIIMAGADRRPTLYPLDGEERFPGGIALVAHAQGNLETGRDPRGEQFKKHVTEELLGKFESRFGDDWQEFTGTKFPISHAGLNEYLSGENKDRFIKKVNTIIENNAKQLARRLGYQGGEFTYYFLVSTPQDLSREELDLQNAVLQQLKEQFRGIAFLRLAPRGDGNKDELDPYYNLRFLLNPTLAPR